MTTESHPPYLAIVAYGYGYGHTPHAALLCALAHGNAGEFRIYDVKGVSHPSIDPTFGSLSWNADRGERPKVVGAGTVRTRDDSKERAKSWVDITTYTITERYNEDGAPLEKSGKLATV